MAEPTTANGLQSALARAAADPSFRTAFVARRSQAAAEAGIALSDSERSVLDAIPEEQLSAMIASLPAEPRPVPMLDGNVVRGIRPEIAYPVMGSRPMVKGHTSRVALAAAGAAVVGGAVCVGAMVLGHRADVPAPAVSEPRDRTPAPDAGRTPSRDAKVDGAEAGIAPKRPR